ncbi:Glutamate-rich protein 4, partial [Galemys pyrenaicus]
SPEGRRSRANFDLGASGAPATYRPERRHLARLRNRKGPAFEEVPPTSHCPETMELWRHLRQAGLVPQGLGPPPKALMGVPPEGKDAQTVMSPGPNTGGARESLLWIWEELGNLRRVDVQLLGQLCSLGLEMGTLREEMLAFLEEEDENDEIMEEETDEDLEEEEGGPVGASCLGPNFRLPDFEMTI